MSESEPAAITTSGCALAGISTKSADPLTDDSAGLPVNWASAFSSFVIFSAMLASSAPLISLFLQANTCAANLATLAGFTMNAFDEPGGFVRQVLFIPSGGQETIGNSAK